jgi:undecaprenyl-diphosphatase
MPLTPANRRMRSSMARLTALNSTQTAIAWMDQAELAICLRFNRSIRRAGLLRVFRIASRLGDGAIWYLLISMLALCYGTTGRRMALQCVVAGLAGLLIYRTLKRRLVRERPYMTHGDIVCAGRPLDRFSFPSGHTLHAVSFTLIVASSVPALALVLAPLALLVALSRIVLGLHYPTDVVAGGALGAMIATLSMHWLPV